MVRNNSCNSDIRAWIAANFLKLNVDKTELLLIGNPQRGAKIQNVQVLVSDNAVKPSASARNLGFYFNSTLSFK